MVVAPNAAFTLSWPKMAGQAPHAVVLFVRAQPAAGPVTKALSNGELDANYYICATPLPVAPTFAAALTPVLLAAPMFSAQLAPFTPPRTPRVAHLQPFTPPSTPQGQVQHSPWQGFHLPQQHAAVEYLPPFSAPSTPRASSTGLAH